jgi:AdoMet-dependent rRNA methyltransferase SPB1
MIIGVDLASIKPVPGCISFIGDITTESTTAQIKAELRHLKADVVLHDGSPNVGVSWENDAYN